MRPISQMSKSVAAHLSGIFMDIDGTLTDGGRLLAEAYSALWRLHAAGLRVVPVTGRPAGWCDLIVRQWPVDAVVGENGAFALWLEDGHRHELVHPDITTGDAQKRLVVVRDAILSDVPGSRVAKDQPFRRYDLAIDFCEEPPDLGLDAADRIREVFVEHGAHAKISSIHVNGWYGDYDKLTMVELLAENLWGIDIRGDRDRYGFCGDSPNDEPMFEFFPHACAVANVLPFANRMGSLPQYVTGGSGGIGFAEMVDVILEKRRG
ncbi:MAG: hypothetical protein A2289_23110 [Deltaproteobacteria bacterium RIFOXYA12_FULL_58_15]|nr:MAG: hypothetical protein A2289_23110 [Deltaproteobacteria bacterium RIFOXYA12_FULL_58_15]OGR07249.1 MAG: hypothetical protein A2341_11160 [Deltaproteobacteria bacterium RIFOXYB12_FULL_58_9]